MGDPQGYLNLVLHAHLPYVRHPEYPDFLEEDWLYEAITETYVPILDMMERSGRRKRSLPAHDVPHAAPVQHAVGRSFDAPLPGETRKTPGVGRKRSGARAEPPVRVSRDGRDVPDKVPSGARYLRRVRRAAAHPFQALQDAGLLEIITCGATHGYLPLMIHEESRRAQIRIAVPGLSAPFRPRAPGHLARRMRLRPRRGHGIERKRHHVLLPGPTASFSKPRPRYGVFAPIFLPRRCGVFRPRHGNRPSGVVRGAGVPRRFQLPRVLPGHGLRFGLQLYSSLPARRRGAAEHGDQVPPRHRARGPGRQGTLRAPRARARRPAMPATFCSTGNGRWNI
jgi:1,4-alpha-glucan branching enzyme